MVSGFSARIDEIRDSTGVLCVGIDPSPSSLSNWGLADTADSALEMGRVVLGAAEGRVGIVKPQVAYFERFGSAGFVALESVIRDARSAGFLVIADAKRGDIGTTMEGYAAAWLGSGPMQSDAVTVSPYQGFDALEPAFQAAESSNGGVFVLCATSNSDASGVQAARIDNQSLSASIAKRARERSEGRQTVGVVVGATRSLAESGLTETDLEDLLILAPGFGAQGAALSDIPSIFGRNARRVIPSVSRSILGGGTAGVTTAIDSHLRELSL
jgi:orotidine-5'-phosphate decarboxylase